MQAHGTNLTPLDGTLFWTHFWSDILIGAAYVVISFALAYFVHRARRDIPFSVVFIAFGLFIVTCGLTHFMAVLTLWEPEWWVSGGIKVVTAAASVATAAAMPFTVPQALTTIRTAKAAREHEVAAARAAALEEQNALLQEQAVELEFQHEEALALAGQLEEANSQLRSALSATNEARLQAEAASRSKSLFLGTMSHELRTPLNAIIGYEELLEMELAGPVTPKQQEHLKRIHHSASHLLGVIDEILTMTRIETHQESVQVELVTAGDIARGTVEMLERTAVQKGLKLTTLVSDPHLAISTDARKLRQILLNLLSNAIKFTDAGEVVLRVRGSGDGVEFSVEDTGIGISEADIPQLFEMFWQADQTTTRAHGGTGLGLTVSRKLVQLLGGEIGVKSEKGVGSTFTVTLPLQYTPEHSRGATAAT